MGNFILVGTRTIDRSRITGWRDTRAQRHAEQRSSWTERLVLAGAGALGVSLAFLLDPIVNLFA